MGIDREDPFRDRKPLEFNGLGRIPKTARAGPLGIDGELVGRALLDHAGRIEDENSIGHFTRETQSRV